MPEALPSKVIIRRAAPRDEKRWRELFDGYCVFYKRTPSELLTRHTWARIMDDASPIHAIVAEDQKGRRHRHRELRRPRTHAGPHPGLLPGRPVRRSRATRGRGWRASDRLASGRNEARG